MQFSYKSFESNIKYYDLNFHNSILIIRASNV